MGGDNTGPAPDIRADAGPPAKLHSPNVIHLTILDLYHWNTYYLFWTANGGAQSQQRLDGSSQANGTVTYDFRAESGATYVFTVQGCPVSIAGPDSRCSDVSRPATAKAASNTTSLATFLQLSGIHLPTGMSKLGPPYSLRALMNGE